MNAGWNYVMDANRYLGYAKSIESNKATEQSSQHKQDNPPASGGTELATVHVVGKRTPSSRHKQNNPPASDGGELVTVHVTGKRTPYTKRKDIRFFGYENLRDIADFVADDEQRQAIDKYLGSKNYQYTNQPWYAKPYMRMYALPALQTTMGVGQAAAGFETCVMTAGIGCIAGGVLVASGADDAHNGLRNFGVEPAKQVPTLRVQGLQALGLGRGAAESMAAIVDIAAGGVGLLKHYSANIGKTAETVGADQVGHLNHAAEDALAGNNTAARTMSPVDGEMAGVNKPPVTPRTETYYRVEGGGYGNKTSQNRILVNQDGTIKMNPECTGQLCVSTNGPDHARYYLSEKRPGGQVVVFDLDAKVHNDIMKNAVPQKQARQYPNPNAPKITDKNTPGVSIELPDVWKTILEKASSNGRVMTQDEFFKEFGRYEK